MVQETKASWSRVFVRPAESDGADRAAALDAASRRSLQEMIDEFLVAVDDGAALDRYGRPFARDAAQDLHWYLGGHVGEALGAASLDAVRRRDVETLVYQLATTGMSRGRLRALARSVRALYDYAIERGLVLVNPAERVAIPDDDDLPRHAAPAVHPALGLSTSDHVIALAVRVATLGFLICAVTLLGESI
jgi:site-specific recombinase XerC